MLPAGLARSASVIPRPSSVTVIRLLGARSKLATLVTPWPFDTCTSICAWPPCTRHR
jgi:hypothetical protein